LSERCRLLYNFILNERKEAWIRGVYVRYTDQSRPYPASRIMERFLSHNAMWSGCPGSGSLEAFLGNLRQTGLPIQPMKQAPAGRSNREDGILHFRILINRVYN
jgi:hypothetical protein